MINNNKYKDGEKVQPKLYKKNNWWKEVINFFKKYLTYSDLIMDKSVINLYDLLNKLDIY